MSQLSSTRFGQACFNIFTSTHALQFSIYFTLICDISGKCIEAQTSVKQAEQNNENLVLFCLFNVSVSERFRKSTITETLCMLLDTSWLSLILLDMCT